MRKGGKGPGADDVGPCWARPRRLILVIVYESKFGSTRRVAQAIAGALRPTYTVDILSIEDAPGELGMVNPNVSLLIAGAPSQVFGLSTPKSRPGRSRSRRRLQFFSLCPSERRSSVV